MRSATYASILLPLTLCGAYLPAFHPRQRRRGRTTTLMAAGGGGGSAGVAVFGDAANDVPMFRSVGGAAPALRVGMPHATHAELCELANVRAEVSTVLQRCCDARVLTGPLVALQQRGLTLYQVLAVRWHAFVRLALMAE